jgi:hypothetical protein
MSRRIRPAAMDDLALERARQEVDEFALRLLGAPDDYEPLSAKYRRLKNKRKKGMR